MHIRHKNQQFFGPFEPQPSKEQPQKGILSATYLDTIQSHNRLFFRTIPPDPYLVVRGLHNVAEGLLQQQPPKTNDSIFLSGAYWYFENFGGKRRSIFDVSNDQEQIKNPNVLARQGWHLLFAEDTLALQGILDARLPKGHNLHTKSIDIGRPHHRLWADQLLRESNNEQGIIVNAAQEIFSNRIRGSLRVFSAIKWFSKTVDIQGVNDGALSGTDYKLPDLESLRSRKSATEAFLENVAAHQALPIAR